MPRRSPVATCTCVLVLALSLPSCNRGDDSKKSEPQADTKTAPEPAPAAQRDPGTSLDKAAVAIDLAGPVPPEATGVFFTVDGALIPIGCYLADKKKIAGGKDCLAAAKAGDEVYLKARASEQLDTLGAPKDALCEVGGGGTPSSMSVPAVDAGATFDFATSPKSLARVVIPLPETSWGEQKPALSAEELAELTKLAKIDGELSIRQVGLVDIDGDENPDKLVTAFQIHPKDSERFSFSGVFVQRTTIPGTWTVVESIKNDVKSFTIRAVIDFEGDRNHELWVNALLTDGGGGDRIYQLTKTGATGLAQWTCSI